MWGGIHYAQDLVQWRAALNVSIDVRDAQKEGNSLTNCGAISFSRSILRHGVYTIYIISVNVKMYCDEDCAVPERLRLKIIDIFRNSLMWLRECTKQEMFQIVLPIYSILLWLYSPLFCLCCFFSFLILITVDRTPWTGDQPITRPLPTHRTTQT
jgi:hypothetical protein